MSKVRMEFNEFSNTAVIEWQREDDKDDVFTLWDQCEIFIKYLYAAGYSTEQIQVVEGKLLEANF
jgi:hypothetical protein